MAQMTASLTTFAVPQVGRGLPAGRAGSRVRAPWRARADRLAAEAGTLAAVARGTQVRVVEVAADIEPEAVRRLEHLGFAPGARVEVVRRAPVGDPTVYRVADTEIALRRRHAAMIRVEDAR